MDAGQAYFLAALYTLTPILGLILIGMRNTRLAIQRQREALHRTQLVIARSGRGKRSY